MNLTGPVFFIKKSLDIFFKKENVIYFLKIYSVSFIVGLLFNFTSGSIRPLEENVTKGNFQFFLDRPYLVAAGVFLTLLAYLITLWAQVASYEAVKRVLNREALSFRSTYSSAWKLLFKFFTTSFLVGLTVILGLVLLIIPGIIFSVWFAFSLFEVINGKGTTQAMKESKRLSSGKFWKVLERLIVFGLFAIIVSAVFGLAPYGRQVLSLFGAIFILPSYLLYKELTG